MANPMQIPTQTPPLNALIPPIPPPPSPSLGFQVWASDPQNAMKVAHNMTAPNAPLQPNAGSIVAGNQPPIISAAAKPPQMPNPLMPPGGLPDVPGPAAPNVSNPLENKLATDQAEQDRLRQNGAGVNEIKNPFLRIAAKVGDIAAPFLLGRGAMAIPGTTAHNLWMQDRQAGVVAGDQDALTNALNRDLTQANISDKSLISITPEMAQSMGNPSLTGTMVTQQALQRMVTNAHTNDTRETVAGTNANARVSAAQIATDARKNIAALKPEQRDDRAIRILATPPNQRTPDDVAYLRGYNQWVQQTKVAPGVARAQAYAQWKPVQVVDPATGNTYYASAAAAIGSHAPGTSSIPFRTASAMARYMTSGKGGSTMTAYRTATDHLDLLGKATDALQNGDIPAFNRLGNALAQETGSPAPTNFNSVKAMLKGELANVSKASGATDAEIATMGAQIDRAASPAQLRGVIDTNQELMDQKAKEMFDQYQSGMQGQPVLTTGGMNPSRRAPLGNPLKPPTSGMQTFTDSGRTYRIPTSEVSAFKKDHPNAR